MLELTLFHGLGIICLIGILAASRFIVKSIRAESPLSVIIAVFVGVLSFTAAYGTVLFLYMKADRAMLDRVYAYTSVAGRLYCIFLISSCVTLLISSTAGYVFRKYCKSGLIISIAFMLNLFVSLQPAGYVWTSWLFSSL